MRTAALVVALLALTAAPAAADVSGPDIVGFLNAQRAANGIPAGIVEDPARSDGCAKHNAYDERNHTLVHEESVTAPGYTPEGDTAARTSVLYADSTWTATSNPFETAPIHLHQLFSPRIDVMGASENGGYGCATTLASQNRPAPPADITYTYPGDGRDGWPVAQTASEGPYTPGERVGIAAGAQTGPYLYAMFDGPDLFPGMEASMGRATLTGPAGPVDVAVVDNTTDGLQGYLPTGVEVIPRAPLTPFTPYTVNVGAVVNGRPFTHQWTFTTGGTITGRGYTVGKLTIKRRRVTVPITPQVPLTIVVRLTGRRKSVELRPRELAQPGSISVRIPKALGNKPKLHMTVTAGDKTTVVVRRIRFR